MASAFQTPVGQRQAEASSLKKPSPETGYNLYPADIWIPPVTLPYRFSNSSQTSPGFCFLFHDLVGRESMTQ
jgi:hypothetical protein